MSSGDNGIVPDGQRCGGHGLTVAKLRILSLLRVHPPCRAINCGGGRFPAKLSFSLNLYLSLSLRIRRPQPPSTAALPLMATVSFVHDGGNGNRGGRQRFALLMAEPPVNNRQLAPRENGHTTSDTESNNGRGNGANQATYGYTRTISPTCDFAGFVSPTYSFSDPFSSADSFRDLHSGKK
ncbi:hypothetical protein PIB30_002706 [Stylosanthes scabra]|uniref:Uncharacterized protein n=1 Tax=Stylosanthes scabra TaxID=79078 RepID=A0ABU6R3P2_9FABA|nr:hypothetical protein [Stylosanthes scabra]